MTMALTKPALTDLAQTLSMMIDAVERGITPERLRKEFAAAGIHAKEADPWVELATELHEAIQRAPKQPPDAVRNPRFRKGTAMKPVAWEDCLWRPTP